MDVENINNNQSGSTLIIALLSTVVFLSALCGLISLALLEQKLYTQQAAKHEATHMAEAGINYYVWLLAHEPEDYYDGTGADPGPSGEPYGPYVHTFTEPVSGLTGTYSLDITPPIGSSTIVTIQSTGWMNDYPSIKSEITVQYGKPSLAHFSFLTNTDAWFGENESLSGEVHANGGIRMDGSNDAIVTSLQETYTCLPKYGCACSCSPASRCTNLAFCPGLACCGETKPGVWGVGLGSSLWQYPVPIVNFDVISTNLDDFQDAALNFGPSGGSNKGYHIIFQNNGTFDVRTVNTLKAALRQKNDDWTGYVNISEEINTETALGNYPIPSNGQIFFEDDLWVEGTVNGRATIVAALLSGGINQWKTIHINNNINYLARDGSHILGLIAQKHIKVPRHAPTDLTIDAILLAINGHVFRNYYPNNKLVKNSITVYGGILSKQDWNWTWVSGITVVDGYTNTASVYDPQVTYSAPPSFPPTSDYAFISWDED